MTPIKQPDTFLRYAVFFTGKTNGEVWVQATNSQLSPHHALEDAREHRADGYEVIALIEIDLLTGLTKPIQNRQQITAMFDKEDYAREIDQRNADIEDDEYHSFAQQMRGWGAAL